MVSIAFLVSALLIYSLIPQIIQVIIYAMKLNPAELYNLSKK